MDSGDLTPHGNVDADILSYVEATFGPVESLQPVTGGGAQGAAVWHGLLASGEQIALKRHAHRGAVQIEFGVLQMLSKLGAPVPQPVGFEPRLRVLATEWQGQGTLAAAVNESQSRGGEGQRQLGALARSLVHACRALEIAFQGLGERLSVSKTGEEGRRRVDMRQRCARTLETYKKLAAKRGRDVPVGWEKSLQDALTLVLGELLLGDLTFGGRDCTPRNVLTDGAQVWFIDFAVIGLDWPEARLAQYAAFIGSEAPETLPLSLLTHGEERWYVESGCIESAALDMQHLLLWSEAARLILDQLPERSGNVRPLDEQRLEQALGMALAPLAANSPAATVRSLIADVCVKS